MTDPFAKLTPRELEVCAYVADGVTRKHIAARMQITLLTVDTYLCRIADKLPAPEQDEPPRTRIQRIAYLYRLRPKQAA